MKRKLLQFLLVLSSILLVASPAMSGSILLLANAGGAASFTGPGDVQTTNVKVYYGLRAYTLATITNKLVKLCDHLGANCADLAGTSSNNGKPDLSGGTITRGADNCASVTTCTIQTFYDISGQTNCTAAACDVTQATVASQATFNWNGGAPYAVFSGTSVYASAAVLTTNIVQPFTASAVANMTTGALYNLISDGPQNTVIGFGTAVAQCYAGNAFVTQTVTVGAYSSIQYFLNGVSSSTEVNGSTGTVGDAGSSTFGSGTIQLGAQNGGTRFFIGQFREGGIYNGAISDLTANQRSAVSGWNF